jgi:thiamine-phosphate pyrophosphorylase
MRRVASRAGFPQGGGTERNVPAKTQLHLISPEIGDPAAFRAALQDTIAACRPASVHLRLAAADAQAAKRAVQALAAVVQDAGAALLIDPPEDFRDVARAGADGVHLSDPDALRAALKELKPDRIVGAGGLRNRDAAMTAGEAGADYVMFGEPRADGSLPPLDQVIERCRWWAEVFNVPCIGFAPGPEAVAALAATGVEFLAFGPWAFTDAAARREAMTALA